VLANERGVILDRAALTGEREGGLEKNKYSYGMENGQNQTKPMSKGSPPGTMSLVKGVFCSHKATPKRKVGA
jgi:hypothetical protein